MADTIKKSKLGAEDIHFDAAGTGSTVSIPKSDGNFRSGSRINAGHVPIKSGTRGKTRIPNATSTATDVDAALGELYDDLNKIGEPDDSSLEITGSGVLQVKALGITEGMLHQASGSEAVTAATIRDDAVTNDAMAANAVSGSAASGGNANCIQAASIDTTELAADCINGDKIEDLAVDSEHLAAGAVGIAKMDMDGAGDTPFGYIVAMGQHTGISATPSTGNAIGITPAAGDRVFAMMQANGNTTFLQEALINGSNLEYIFSAAPSSATINFLIVRLTA